ncbi:MAG: putative DNA-binding transcriptional regulator YafY [Maribacter sp.]|jgi:predicted DNA-binding transcriptional regulator YafY
MKESLGAKERVLKLLFLVVESPHRYTKKDLSEMLSCSEKSIYNGFKDLEREGVEAKQDERARYYFLESKQYHHLQDLLLFTEEDRGLLASTIDSLSKGKRAEKLKRKLAGIYDFKKLGHSFLRVPYLTKVDKLEEAKKNKKIVILKDYNSSNSNTLTDRRVEVFHITANADTIQTYDIEQKDLRHFRLSRFTRVVITDDTWQYEGHHVIRKTDPFRIVNNNQIFLHIRFRIGAKNELLERFPLTRTHIIESDEEGIYDLQCHVNRKFYGITNFILGYHHDLVEICAPDELIDHLNEKIKSMNF